MISIVIPNYNGNAYLQPCIHSIMRQNYDDLEIIIIDNASTDSDYEWVREYEHIKFVRLDKNYGFSRAINEGVKLAQYEFVVLLNNDTELKANFLVELERAIRKDEKIFSVCSKMIRYDNPNLIDDAGDEYTILGWAYKRGDGKSINQYNRYENVFSSCAGAAIYRKSLLQQLGGFDESFFAYMEDVDLSYRANLQGYKNMYCPKAQVYHIGSATTGSKYNSFKVRLAARNNIYVVYKNMPTVQLILNFPMLLLGWIIKYVFFRKIGYDKEYIEGFKEGISNLSSQTKHQFSWEKRYIYIEWVLIRNTFSYIKNKVIEVFLKNKS